MKIVRSLEQMRELTRKAKLDNRTIGFVPTMGALHEGHMALLDQARKENDLLVLSIFVNPLQFGPAEDFDRYPKQLEKDARLAEGAGVDLLFYPPKEEMYRDSVTVVEVKGADHRLCGKFRPGHFQGVATVVLKLFNITRADKSYFGEKDYQQFRLIKKMVEDLNVDVEVVGVPIVREESGLALSSRNVYLSAEEKQKALSLPQSFRMAEELVKKGERKSSVIEEKVRTFLESAGGEVQYVELCDENTLERIDSMNSSTRLLIAVYMGKTRLIDNERLEAK